MNVLMVDVVGFIDKGKKRKSSSSQRIERWFGGAECSCGCRTSE